MRQAIALWISQQRKIPYRMRKSFIKRIYPVMLKDYRFDVDFYGMRYTGSTNNAAERAIFMFGGAEKHVLAFMRDYCIARGNKDAVFLDVGAHIGNHSLFMSCYVRKVHAFEPIPAARKRMEANIVLNDIRNILEYPIGLGNESGEGHFYVSGSDNIPEGTLCRGHEEYKEYYADIEMRTGDEIVREKNIKNIEIIKIDVAGFERRVIEGFTKTIEAMRPLIILEISAQTRKSFGSRDDFETAFPDNYSFYKFFGIMREKDTYSITKFDYELQDTNLNVIALPKEKQVYISTKVV